MNNVLERSSIILLFFTLFGVNYSVVVQDEDCKSWCITANGKNCSEVMTCRVQKQHDWYFPEANIPPPKPTDFKIEVKCDNTNISDIKLGLLISWKIRGEFLQSGLVTHFVILLEDYEFLEDPPEFIKVVIPSNITGDRYIKTEYFYHETGDLFKIQAKGTYQVAIFSEPRMTNRPTNDTSLWAVVPVYYEDQIESCKNNTQIATTDAPLPNSNEKYVIMITISAACFAATLVVLIIVWKMIHKRTLDNSVKNVFIFLNPAVSENVNLKEATYRFSHIISTQQQFEVCFNLEQSTNTQRILETIQSNIRWADIIILISIPDGADCDTDQFYAANNAIVHAIEVHILNGPQSSKKFIAVYTNDAKQHIKCPFRKIQKVKKVRVEREKWSKVYKKISAKEITAGDLECQRLISSETTVQDSIANGNESTATLPCDGNTEETQI